MFAAADIVRRLVRAAWLHRAPAWIAAVVPWLALRLPLAATAAVIVVAADVVHVRRRVAANWPCWLDAELAALEDSSALLINAASPIAQLQQKRILQRIDGELDGAACARVARDRFGWALWLPALSIATAAAWSSMPRPTVHPTTSAPRSAAATPAPALRVRVTPPAYTGAAGVDSAPRDLQVAAGSIVQWCASADSNIELSDGQTLKTGQNCAQWTATESIFWRWQGTRYNLRVTPDLPPQITVTAPKEMVATLARDARSAVMSITVQDDYRVERATLHLTLARGSGENIRFSDRELPIPAGPDARLRKLDKSWSLAELGMEPGDELYFFVRASDNAAQPHVSQSPTYTLRLPGPVAESEDTTAMPMLAKPENLRSQRQIIIDTEQLVADMRTNPRVDARSRSEAIASDQAVLRRRYGQFLGEESTLFGGDDHEDDHGGKHDIVAEFGHTHDQPEAATFFDEATKKVLRRALTAMWEAERELRAITPKSALPPEYKALEAIKQLQQAERIYLHKTAFAPPAIKEEKRLSGDATGASSYKRPQSEQDDMVPAEVRALIQALSTDAPLPALWSRQAQDWIRTRLAGDEQRLAAQRAVQDVSDGCQPCRATLRAWLRSGIAQAPVLVQPQAVVRTPLDKAMQEGAQ